MPTIRTVYTFDSWYQQSSTRISSNNVYPYDGFNHIQVNCTGVSKTLMWNFVGLDSNGNIVLDYYWYSSETTIDIPTNTSMVSWLLWLKDANGGSITGEDVTSCEAVVEETTVWVIGSSGLTNENFEPRIEYNMASPYPNGLWRIGTNSIPTTELLNNTIELGAFANATNLRQISIPKSCKKIGKETFRNTQLTSVTIASDCEYYHTSFPDGCVVNFYPD